MHSLCISLSSASSSSTSRTVRPRMRLIHQVSRGGLRPSRGDVWGRAEMKAATSGWRAVSTPSARTPGATS